MFLSKAPWLVECSTFPRDWDTFTPWLCAEFSILMPRNPTVCCWSTREFPYWGLLRGSSKTYYCMHEINALCTTRLIKVYKYSSFTMLCYLLIVEVKFREFGGKIFSCPVIDIPLTSFCPDLALLWILLEELVRCWCWFWVRLPAECTEPDPGSSSSQSSLFKISWNGREYREYISQSLKIY